MAVNQRISDAKSVAIDMPAGSFSMAFLVPVILSLLLVPVVGLAQEASLVQPHQQFEAAKARGDLTAAIDYGRQALDLAEQIYGADSLDIVGTLVMMGEVLSQAGEFEEAIRFYNRAIEIMEREFGAQHPELVPTLELLVDINMLQEEYLHAEKLLKRILDIERAAYGEAHKNVVITLNRLRGLYEISSRPADVARVDNTLESLSMRTRDLDLTDPGDGPQLDSRRYSTKNGFAMVRVFYGTNRARTGQIKASQFYGTERGDLDLGYLDVSIPETHKYGDLETSSRWSIYTYRLGEDALKKKFILLLDVQPLDQQNFHAQLQEHVRSSPSNDVFMFVHGYNSSFEDAARRTAQLAYDLDFDGTPVMYSWPSQASATAYTVDEAAVRVSGRKMVGFLTGLVEQAGADRIHLIAHSMGNRALIEALETFAARRAVAEPVKVFDQIVFTAPDVDRDYFMDVIASIQRIASRVTLYASQNDVALQTSAVLHGAPRAGLAGEGMVILPGLDTIDMSAVEADRLGHSYFAANAGAIYDLFRLLWLGDPPQQRCGMNNQIQGTAEFWLFDVETCRGGEVLEAGLLIKRFGETARDRVKRRLSALTDETDEVAREEWSRILDRLDTLLEPDEV